MADVLSIEEMRTRLNDKEKYLVYFIPVDYIMQGLIADTGEDWRLYRRHFTIRRFLDWVFHPSVIWQDDIMPAMIMHIWNIWI